MVIFDTQNSIEIIINQKILIRDFRLDHPSGIFPKLLETMYNSDVVKYPACQEWKADMNHPAGKSLAVQELFFEN